MLKSIGSLNFAVKGVVTVKIEKLEMNKIKVTLSAMDLVDMNVNVRMLTPNSPHLHDFLHEVMEKVRAETGFNPYNGQVVVEATPKEDGIILTVTKLGEEKKKRPKKIKVSTVKGRYTYRFSSFENLCELFRNKDSEVFSKSALYEYMDKFYMVIPKGAISGISEFAEKYSGILLNEYFLKEHGKCHAECERLVSMAEGVRNM